MSKFLTKIKKYIKYYKINTKNIDIICKKNKNIFYLYEFICYNVTNNGKLVDYMELISVKCPNCGANVSINNDHKTAYCNHCNSSFLIKDAVSKPQYIQKTTIIKDDSADEILYNEVDKYIAQFNLQNYDLLESIASNALEKFPHKGLARIIILHYQFTQLFLDIGNSNESGYDIFVNEFESIDSRYLKYNPKNYKHIPPTTDFLLKSKPIELKYAENIEDYFTDTEREEYAGFIDQTLEYLEQYKHIVDMNRKIEDKFVPFESKLLKKASKKQLKKIKKQKSKKYAPLYLFISVVLIIIITSVVLLVNYQSLKNKRTFIDSFDDPYINTVCLAQPTFIGTATQSIYYSDDITLEKLGSYVIYGRVAGKHSFWPLSKERKLMPVAVALSWGNYSNKEMAKQIDWNYSVFSDGYKYNRVEDYIDNYFSTNMLIPANSEIRSLFKVISENDIVKIVGQIVNVTISSSDKKSTINSSTDYLGSSYQIVYVTEIYWING